MNYTLKRNKRSKHIRIRLSDRGEVIATAPPFVPKFMVTKFVRKSEGWIIRQRQKQKLSQLAHPVIDWDEQLISFKGKLYYFKFEPDQTEKVVVGTKYIHIRPITGLETDFKKTLLHWLKKEAETYIHSSLKIWSEKMNLSYKQVKFRQQKSRWGSCSSRGNLNFNWRLIHFKPEIIDYVVIHELAHLRHHNHSKAFWSFVAQFEPNYKQHAKFLKSQHIAIEKM